MNRNQRTRIKSHVHTAQYLTISPLLPHPPLNQPTNRTTAMVYAWDPWVPFLNAEMSRYGTFVNPHLLASVVDVDEPHNWRTPCNIHNKQKMARVCNLKIRPIHNHKRRLPWDHAMPRWIAYSRGLSMEEVYCIERYHLRQANDYWRDNNINIINHLNVYGESIIMSRIRIRIWHRAILRIMTTTTTRMNMWIDDWPTCRWYVINQHQ